MIKRLDIETNTNNNFIGCWKIDKEICNQIISFYENNIDDVRPGEAGSKVNLEVKKSEDITISPKDLVEEKYHCFQPYMKNLLDCYNDYIKQWSALKNLFSVVECSSFNIQKYYPGGHFKKFHMERTNILNSSRIFAWMTYLNEVEEGGNTDFLYYDLSIKPELGKTIIWPAEWTHAHKGNIVEKGLKYVITGWFHMPDELDYNPQSPTYGVPLKKE